VEPALIVSFDENEIIIVSENPQKLYEIFLNESQLSKVIQVFLCGRYILAHLIDLSDDIRNVSTEVDSWSATFKGVLNHRPWKLM
jgi:hypothetical protein